MAKSFVGGPFKYDVFISYSHGDPMGEGDSNLKQWSARFWEELRRDFRSYEDMPDFSIFFDSSPRLGEGIDPFAALDRTLQDHAGDSAVLLALVSPFYMLSGYCAREREWWNAGQADKGYDAGGRIAPAIVWGIPQRGKANWPDALKEIGFEQTGIRFFDPAFAATNPKPFGWPGIAERISDERFHDALQRMVTTLREHLKTLHERITAREAAASLPAFATRMDMKPSIYLHGRSDNVKPWEKAADALLDRGFPVFPEEPEPVEADTARRQAVRERRVATMATCDALLMVAPDDPQTFSEELMILGKADRGLAIDRAEREHRMQGKQLPGAVIDEVTEPGRARRRELQARNTRLGWFSQSDPDWVGKTGQWLVDAVK